MNLRKLIHDLAHNRLARILVSMAVLSLIDHLFLGGSTTAQTTLNAVIALSFAWATDKPSNH